MLLQEDAKEHKYVVKSQHFSNYTKQFSRKEFVPSKLLAGYPCTFNTNKSHHFPKPNLNWMYILITIQKLAQLCLKLRFF